MDEVARMDNSIELAEFVEVTHEFLSAGATSRGGFTKRQTTLFGLEWPLPHGWKKRLIGTRISKDVAAEFIQLAENHRAPKPPPSTGPVNWFHSPNPVEIYLYVLELQDQCYYVGLTSDVANRMSQHFSGEGAQWTLLHRPIKVLHTISTGTKDAREAERKEDEVTIALMMKYGIGRVRGGHFCNVEQHEVDAQLRARGVWLRIKQSDEERQTFNSELSWGEALDDLQRLALAFYDAGSPPDRADDLFSALFKLTRFQHWRPDLEPCLDWPFWSRKGILPVLLSFKLARPVASGLATPYDVLAAACNRGSGSKHPLRRLFLQCWKAFQPPVTEKHAKGVDRLIDSLGHEDVIDRQYDAFVSVLFPETRHLLRDERV